VRYAIVFSLLLVAHSAFAQKQERKLIDRLLEPDMTLANPAQDKHFDANQQTRMKRVVSHDFVTHDITPAKEFSAKRGFFARVFGTRAFRQDNNAAAIPAKSEASEQTKSFAAQQSPLPHGSADAGKRIAASEFNDTRPFLGRGKSQKALSQHDTPLTIDQVRELLNRNK
jgi:hypothetical protein